MFQHLYLHLQFDEGPSYLWIGRCQAERLLFLGWSWLYFPWTCLNSRAQDGLHSSFSFPNQTSWCERCFNAECKANWMSGIVERKSDQIWSARLDSEHYTSQHFRARLLQQTSYSIAVLLGSARRILHQVVKSGTRAYLSWLCQQQNRQWLNNPRHHESS